MSIAQIVEVLGGKRTFKKPMRKADDLVAQVRAGLPASTVDMLAGVLSLHRTQIAKCLNIPSRTLSRRLATMRMARVVALANEILGAEDKAQRWMVAPNRALGGRKPFDQLDTELGVRSVEEVLQRIAYGMYS